MDKTNIVKSVKRVITNDPRYKKLKKAFIELPEYNLNLDEIEEELTSQHESRSVRRLRRRLNEPKFIDETVKALLKDQEVRSRITEIRISCVNTSSKLEDILGAFRQYILTEYYSELSNISTKGERDKVVESSLRPFYKYLTEVDRVSTKSLLLIEDIDKAAYTLKNTIEAIKLITHKSATV